jgi:hypothetical protein
MQNQNTRIPTKWTSSIVSIILILDGFSTLALGLLFFIISGLGDPVDFSVEIKDANVRRGELVALLTFVYLVTCFISLIYWKKGKQVWRYIILGLGLIPIVWSIILFIYRDAFTLLVTPSDEFDSVTYLLIGSFLINILLGVLVIFGRNKKEELQSGQT